MPQVGGKSRRKLRTKRKRRKLFKEEEINYKLWHLWSIDCFVSHVSIYCEMKMIKLKLSQKIQRLKWDKKLKKKNQIQKRKTPHIYIGVKNKYECENLIFAKYL